MSDLAQDIMRRFEDLRAARSVWDSLWQDIAEHVRPQRAEFSARPARGARRDRRIYDNAPGEALETFAAGLYGMLTNPANTWFALRFNDPDLNNWHGARLWLDEAGRALADSMGPSVSRFYSVLPSLYLDWAAFGTAVFYSEDIAGSRRIYDCVRPLSECYVGTGVHEEVDRVFRLTRMSAQDIGGRFGPDLPERIRTAFDRGDALARFDVIHAVEPDPEARSLGGGAAPMPYRSVYVDRESGTVLGSGRFAGFPYQVPRWSMVAGEVYGRPKDILADVKMLHEMNRTLIVSAQRAAEPPILAYRENRASPIRMTSGGITYGAVNADGRSLIQPFQSGIRLDITAEMIQDRRNAIRDALFSSLMQMGERPTMTATEVLERQEEKLRLMGPHLGRLQSEFLSPFIKRRFALLARKGLLPPAPPELKGRPLDIEYVSPLARAVRMAEAGSISRWLGAIAPVLDRQPHLSDRLDGDAILEVLAAGFAVPARVLRPPDDPLTVDPAIIS